jgi:crotonobetainyl-CoA:carnitine CoA-transferase CaiB-like acyl-CoA transferase
MGPLAGVRVIELGSVVLAPYAAQWLGDMGAEVIKVEPPGGDSTRRTGPAPEPGRSALFLGVNRNKKSVVLDLKTDAGREALLALADRADVLVHNTRPQKMKALGLGPEALRERNPRLIYACLHGFGERGPYGGRPAYDDTIQGLCGLADLVGRRDGAPGYLPTIVADKTTGLVAAIAILAALCRQRTTDQGAYVEVPMFESMVAFTAVEHFWGRHLDPPVGEGAYPRVFTPSRRPFRTTDGYVCILPYTDRHWRDLAREGGLEDLIDDPRVATLSSRTASIAELYDRVAATVSQQPTAFWLELCERLEIPFAPVRSLAELEEDPHLIATGFFSRIDSDGAGMRFPGSPVLFDGERPTIEAPPRLGEHTRPVLRDAGLTEASIDRLVTGGTS